MIGLTDLTDLKGIIKLFGTNKAISYSILQYNKCLIRTRY